MICFICDCEYNNDYMITANGIKLCSWECFKRYSKHLDLYKKYDKIKSTGVGDLDKLQDHIQDNLFKGRK